MSTKLEEIFFEELEEDLPRLDKWISNRDADAIYRFANKHKVHVSHTKYKSIANKCIEIEKLYHSKAYNQMITLAEGFRSFLQGVLDEVKV